MKKLIKKTIIACLLLTATSVAQAQGPVANLTIICSSNVSGTVVVGDNISTTITVKNNGPDAATNVQVTDVLDTNLSFVSASPSLGSYTFTGNTLKWTIATLANGQSATLVLTVKVIAAGTLNNCYNNVTVYNNVYGLLFNVADGKFYLDLNGNGELDAGEPQYTPPTGATSWNSGSKTLTLNNFSWETSAAIAFKIVGGDITLNITGTNTFKSIYSGINWSAGIDCNPGALSIGGTGTLNAESANGSICRGIFGNGSIALTGATVNVTAIGSGVSYGIHSQTGSIIISGGTLTAQGSSRAIGNLSQITLPASYTYWTSATLPYTPTGSGITYPNGSNPAFSNTSPPRYVKITPPKTVSAGTQSGTRTYGTAGSSTYTLTTANITNGTYPVTLGGTIPAGVTAANVVINGNSGTLTINTTAATPAGTYSFTATIDGVMVNISLTVNKKSVTITGITATKVYDGSAAFTNAQIDITAATITGKVGTDNLTVSKTGVTGTLPSANAGSGNLTLSGSFALGGTALSNYTLSAQPTVAATITKAAGVFGTPAAINTTYTTTLKLSDLTLPTGYAWVTPTTAITTPGNGQTFPATYTDPSGNYEKASGFITVNVSNPNGVFEISANDQKIYPNPVKDELRIEGGDLIIIQVKILDITGKIVGNSTNVSALPKGIYFVKLKTDKGTVTKKFIKE